MSKNKTNNAEQDLADMKKLVHARNAEVDNLRRRVKELERTVVEMSVAYASVQRDFILQMENRRVLDAYGDEPELLVDYDSE